MSKKSKARKEQRNQKAGVSSFKLSQVPGFRTTQAQIHSGVAAILSAMESTNLVSVVDIAFPHVADDVKLTLAFTHFPDDSFEVQLERTGYITTGPVSDFFEAYKAHVVSILDGGIENYRAALRDLQDALARLFMAKIGWVDAESSQFVPAPMTKWTRMPA